MKYNIFFVSGLFSVFLFVSGCATRGYIPPPQVRPSLEVKGQTGIYHQVKKGETLYKIAQGYDVSLDKIVAINRIPDPARIEKGQLIFIPGVLETKAAASYRPDTAGRSGYIWPVQGRPVSSFGQKTGRTVNKGIDIKAKEGTDIRAAKAGVVSFCSDELKGYGKIVIIDHKDGYQSVYAYNNDNLVKAGQRVEQGQAIARVGNTGRTSEPMLHFEIRKGSEPQNPFYFLPE